MVWFFFPLMQWHQSFNYVLPFHGGEFWLFQQSVGCVWWGLACLLLEVSIIPGRLPLSLEKKEKR